MKVFAEIELDIDACDVSTEDKRQAILSEVFESGCESCCASGNINIVTDLNDIVELDVEKIRELLLDCELEYERLEFVPDLAQAICDAKPFKEKK